MHVFGFPDHDENGLQLEKILPTFRNFYLHCRKITKTLITFSYYALISIMSTLKKQTNKQTKRLIAASIPVIIKVTAQNAKIQWLLMESNIIKKSRNIFTLKEDFRISCYDICSSLLSLKDIERQPQRTKKADLTSSGRLITRG